MAMTEKTKLIIVESNGTIGELGGISGPILNPFEVPLSVIVRMINSHKHVYEVNPDNRNERVRLTLQNVRRDNFVQATVVQKNASVQKKSGSIVAAKKATETTKSVVKNDTKTDKKSSTKETTIENDFSKK